MPKSNPYVRVTDKDTGHRISVRESAVPHGNYTVLKADAVDVGGDPLPPEYNATKPLSSTTNSGQQADPEKENRNG